MLHLYIYPIEPISHSHIHLHIIMYCSLILNLFGHKAEYTWQSHLCSILPNTHKKNEYQIHTYIITASQQDKSIPGPFSSYFTSKHNLPLPDEPVEI